MVPSSGTSKRERDRSEDEELRDGESRRLSVVRAWLGILEPAGSSRKNWEAGQERCERAVALDPDFRPAAGDELGSERLDARRRL